jgi:hypothetical protein
VDRTELGVFYAAAGGGKNIFLTGPAKAGILL